MSGVCSFSLIKTFLNPDLHKLQSEPEAFYCSDINMDQLQITQKAKENLASLLGELGKYDLQEEKGKAEFPEQEEDLVSVAYLNKCYKGPFYTLRAPNTKDLARFKYKLRAMLKNQKKKAIFSTDYSIPSNHNTIPRNQIKLWQEEDSELINRLLVESREQHLRCEAGESPRVRREYRVSYS